METTVIPLKELVALLTQKSAVLQAETPRPVSLRKVGRYLSYTLLQQGRAAEAMEQLKVLGSLGKLSGYDLFLTAQALELMGDKKSAAQYYVYAVDEEPSNEFYRLKAIDSLRDLSLYDDATDLVNEGLAMSHDKAVRANYRNKAAQIASARKLVNIQITCHKSLE